MMKIKRGRGNLQFVEKESNNNQTWKHFSIEYQTQEAVKCNKKKKTPTPERWLIMEQQ